MSFLSLKAPGFSCFLRNISMLHDIIGWKVKTDGQKVSYFCWEILYVSYSSFIDKFALNTERIELPYNETKIILELA